MADYRNVWVLILAVGLLQVSGGILGVIAPIGLQTLGLSPLLIGVIGALHAAGFMAGAWVAPQSIARIGNIRVFCAGAAGGAVTSLVMGLAPNEFAWAAARLVQGAAFAWMFASAESWMSAATPAKARGGVLGFYHVIAKVALLVGPFIVMGYAPLEAQAFMWTALFFAAALVPVTMTRRIEPPRSGDQTLPWGDFLKLAPAAVAASFLAGVTNTGLLALLPLFAERVEIGGTATGAAALAMAAAWTGGLVSQWPAGRLSDRVDRRLVVAAMALLAVIAATGLALGVGVLPSPAILALLAIWGAGSLSFYGVAVAHGVDRASQEQIPGLMSGLLFVWAGGSVIGPPLAGFAISTSFGPGGLFIFAVVMTALLIAAMLWRREARPGVPAEDRANWEMTQPTAVTGQEIDPRVDPEASPTTG